MNDRSGSARRCGVDPRPTRASGRRSWFGCLGVACALASTTSLPAAAAPPARLLLAEAVAPAPPSSSAKGESAERESRHLGRRWGWILLSIGGAAGVVAIGTSVVMLVDKATRDGDCDAARACSSGGLTANAQIADLAGWNAGAWGVAAAGFGLGTFLLLTNPGDRATAPQLRVLPSGSGASLSLQAAF